MAAIAASMRSIALEDIPACRTGFGSAMGELRNAPRTQIASASERNGRTCRFIRLWSAPGPQWPELLGRNGDVRAGNDRRELREERLDEREKSFWGFPEWHVPGGRDDLRPGLGDDIRIGAENRQ